MRHECYFCHTKTIEKLIEKFKPEDVVAEDFVFTVNQLLFENRNQSNPYCATLIHRIAKQKINNENLYAAEKRNANKLFLEQYNRLKDWVNKSSNSLHLAAKLAVAGNIIDYGAHTVSGDIEQQVHSLMKNDFARDETVELFEQLQKAKSVLYLGDNAGEIVFDKLFLETINHPNVTYVVRGKPVINDVTLEDAEQCGMADLCEVITNGYDAPSTLLDYCSDEFLEKFHTADLVISKGQGNFEGLMNCERENLFFMLMAKCKPIADLLGVNKGNLLVTKIKK